MTGKIYTVARSMGMDGDVNMFSFSKEEDAKQVCAMYNSSSDAGDYDFFFISETIVDEHPIQNFKLVTDEDGETTLEW